jgi:mono/diheme cytochrome c family protein
MKTFLFFYFVSVAGLYVFLFQEPDLKESMERGRDIYADFCVSCHLEKGEGVMNTFPPLANSDFLMNNREQSIRGIKYGQQGIMEVNGVKYNNVMTALGLEDEEVADVMNFILNSWGNTSETMVTVEEVAGIKK